MNEFKVTSIEQLKEYSRGTIVELPPFAEGQRFVARIKRPSIMHMVKSGKIGNPLLAKTNEMFMTSNVRELDDENMLSEMMDILETIAEDTFIEPSYKDIKGAGIVLTDEQYMFIFNYCQEGVKALESFRSESEDRICIGDVETVS